MTNLCVERGLHPRLTRVDLFDHGVREGVTRDERTTDEVGSTGAELGDDAVPARSRVRPRDTRSGNRLSFDERVWRSGAHVLAFQAAMGRSSRRGTGTVSVASSNSESMPAGPRMFQLAAMQRGRPAGILGRKYLHVYPLIVDDNANFLPGGPPPPVR